VDAGAEQAVARLDVAYPLAPFLRYLATFPRPEAVAEAVARGPLAPLGARTAVIWLAEESNTILRSISNYGLSGDIEQRYASVSTLLDLPNVRAFSENRVTIRPIASMTTEFGPLALDTAIWSALNERVPGGVVVDCPIVIESVPIGVLSLVCDSHAAWTGDDQLLLEGTAAALALWCTNPRSGAVPLRPRAGYLDLPLRLTERQAQVLLLADAGESNARIGALLGYSESTVKQEMQRILRMMRADDRLTAAARAREAGLLPG
jgi:DNA-binding CsgD family transcriptional regulator